MVSVSIIVPCYNEEEILPLTIEKLLNVKKRLVSKKLISEDSKILFVDDGSHDKTWELITNGSHKYNCISGIKLAKNVGHQNALIGGILSSHEDVVISIDADLQDNVDLMEQMILEFKAGNDIVYAARKSRLTDSFFKKTTAQFFYKLMLVMGVEIIYNHADYRLLSRRVVEALKKFKEVNLFLRGVIPLIGFQTSTVYYDRAERVAGESKYPFFKMLAFAINGITSFSVVPLRMITFVGLIFSFLSLCVGGWAFYVKIFTENSIPGWTSLLIPLSGIGGVQLFALGIVGEYIGKIYEEIKSRPRFIVDKETQKTDELFVNPESKSH